jgi:hypothetical protein
MYLMRTCVCSIPAFEYPSPRIYTYIHMLQAVVCVYACIYICMCVCVCVCMHARVHVTHLRFLLSSLTNQAQQNS